MSTLAKVVPFVRQLKRGDRGKDVVALQLALRHYYKLHKLGKGPGRTGLFGESTQKAVAEFQRRRGIKADRRGRYERATHKQLAAHYGPSALAKLLEAKRERDQAGPKGVRARIVATAMHAYNKSRFSMRYTQGPARDDWLAQKIRPPRTPPWCDCSSFYEWCLWVAGAPNPNGWSWARGAVGWTGSQILRGKRINSHSAKPGDAAYYPGRSGAIGHVAVIVSATRCVSFGSEPMTNPSIWYRRIAFAINHLGD